MQYKLRLFVIDSKNYHYWTFEKNKGNIIDNIKFQICFEQLI